MGLQGEVEGAATAGWSWQPRPPFTRATSLSIPVAPAQSAGRGRDTVVREPPNTGGLGPCLTAAHLILACSLPRGKSSACYRSDNGANEALVRGGTKLQRQGPCPQKE